MWHSDSAIEERLKVKLSNTCAFFSLNSRSTWVIFLGVTLESR